MPHHDDVYLEGVKIASVNEITNSLSKEGLIQWYRKLGFAEADRQTRTARERGIEVGKLFEDLSTRPDMVLIPSQYVQFVETWQSWVNQGFKILSIEPHLFSKIYGYHGSPDVILKAPDGTIEMGDYKVKGREADYKIMMNEAAYIQAYKEETGTQIERIRIIGFHPDSARLYEKVYPNEPEYFEDFLTCKKMMEVNKKSAKWYNRHCKTKLAA